MRQWVPVCGLAWSHRVTVAVLPVSHPPVPPPPPLACPAAAPHSPRLPDCPRLTYHNTILSIPQLQLQVLFIQLEYWLGIIHHNAHYGELQAIPPCDLQTRWEVEPRPPDRPAYNDIIGGRRDPTWGMRQLYLSHRCHAYRCSRIICLRWDSLKDTEIERYIFKFDWFSPNNNTEYRKEWSIKM